MDPAQKKTYKRKLQSQETDVRAVLNEWAPIAGWTPQDEYDCLVHRVLSFLQQPCTEADVQRLLIEELTNHFGIAPPEDTYDVARRLYASKAE